MSRSEVKRPARAYRSPAREQRALETRRRIREAGRELFLTHGYARTTMAAIAREAGVAEKTVYLAFPSKPALLREVIIVAVRGGEGETPLVARGGWAEALAAPAAEMVPRFAREADAALARVAPVLAMVDAAADGDVEIAAYRDEGRRNRRADMKRVAHALANAGALAEGTSSQRAADVLYALTSPETYLCLTRECRWSRTRYREWLAETLTNTLLGPAAR